MPEVRIDIADRHVETIAEAVADSDELVHALTADVERHDTRAEYVDESFSVQAVARLPNRRVRISYQYEWYAHYGCQDLCSGELESDDIEGRIENRQLIFDVKGYEARSTADEL